MGFKPAPRVKQRLKWGEHWLQFDVEPSSESYEGRSYGGSVTVTCVQFIFLSMYDLIRVLFKRIHNSKRSVLEDLVKAAREEYLKSTVSKVTVHLADRVSFSPVSSFSSVYQRRINIVATAPDSTAPGRNASRRIAGL